MARGVNKVILIGNLGADPDIRYSANGVAVAKFNIATTERVPAGEGQWEEKTEWHRVVAFAKLAENAGQYLSKGRQVYVEGRLRTNQWEDQQGVKRYTTEIVAQNIQFLGGGAEGQGAQPSGFEGSSRSTTPQSRPSRPITEDLPPGPMGPDEDIPF